ncbi:hypothetical protein BDP81DRAFT_6098 [Colletotrichum phormii]|uniref:Uncharacterized protein n=1 Tax=Colletotrichum phormii TaxID=359342 RepID=A0AAJ0ELH8_9PEZI|nr:uncharacterized protein BDP81DRAFT_6098 [Colletotrichum phormii]KAK1655562.1 hypothetical protein BDP81DRAFT_6098 [Colletotrichum phormii]
MTRSGLGGAALSVLYVGGLAMPNSLPLGDALAQDHQIEGGLLPSETQTLEIQNGEMNNKNGLALQELPPVLSDIQHDQLLTPETE